MPIRTQTETPEALAPAGATDAEVRPRWVHLGWVDMFGIDPDYTEGIPADDWLDREHGEA